MGLLVTIGIFVLRHAVDTGAILSCAIHLGERRIRNSVLNPANRVQYAMEVLCIRLR